MLHTCRICYTLNIPSKNIIEEYPRNACEDHLLCNSISKNGMPCCELAVPPINLYCNMHILKDIIIDPGDGQCYGIAKSSKKRCKQTGKEETGGKWYCPAHITQKPYEEKIVDNSSFNYDEFDNDGMDRYDVDLLRMGEIFFNMDALIDRSVPLERYFYVDI
jgi:hypothetical protein